MPPRPSGSVIALSLILAGCHPAVIGNPVPGPDVVAQRAFAAAAAGYWDQAVQSLDSAVAQGYRDAMIQASDFVLDTKPKIYAQADSISAETAAFYARVNAMNAAGGPVLLFMGAKTVDELRTLSPRQFVARFLSGMDSLSTLRDPAHPTRTFHFPTRAKIRDSIATLEYVLPGAAARTLHLVRISGSWRLGEDGLIPLLDLAAR
jgi:hypothetical protein